MIVITPAFRAWQLHLEPQGTQASTLFHLLRSRIEPLLAGFAARHQASMKDGTTRTGTQARSPTSIRFHPQNFAAYQEQGDVDANRDVFSPELDLSVCSP